MSSEFQVSETLTELNESEVKNVVEFIKNNMGVTEESELYVLKETDFTENKILKPIQARRLIQRWEAG